MTADLVPVIAATTRWLVAAYPAPGGVLAAATAQAQARQAVTVAAWLRYPTSVDTGLLAIAGPGGSSRLDWLAGADAAAADLADEHPWRTWVDEVVASWAACLLADPELAGIAVAALVDCEHTSGLHYDFRRLTAPDERDREATILLRHPDLLAAVADLHHASLLERLNRAAEQAA